MSDDRVFRIGLTMAGAISAGSYTAGVFDFLIRALAEWEDARKQDPKSVPEHRAPITVMTGASAGGMTAVLGTIALARALQPTTKTTTGGSLINCFLPSLYAAWVEQVRMVADVGPDLLSTEDIEDGKVRSLLNSKLLDNICSNALRVPSPPPTITPYAFLANPLHVYLTLTNLRGIEYDIAFGENCQYNYRMLSHGDRKHYTINGIGGDAVSASQWAASDPGLPILQISELNSAVGPNPDWQEMCEAALGTGAFPVGLAARIQKADTGNYQARQWPIPTPIGTSIDPAWPDGWTVSGKQFGFVNVDGGVIDNEPFELARYAIKDPSLENNPRSGLQADRAVVMVAPFPEGYAFPKTDPLDDGIITVIKALLPTMIQQTRFKPEELVAAAHPNVYSRFLIAPSRDNGNTVSSDNIACGLLGGFGGFLDQSFREHDFQLGQRNCQQFLLKYFTLPANNGVMVGAGESSPGESIKELPIIPLFNSAVTEIPQPDWPRMSMESYLKLLDRISSRADSVVPLLLKQEISSGLLRLIATIVWKFIPFASLKSKVMDTLRLLIFAELISRDQIEDGLDSQCTTVDPQRLRNYSADQRKILATLANPSFDLRTPSGIKNDTGLSAELIANTLDKACGVPENGVHRVWKSGIKTSSGENSYTLYSRRLGVLNSLPLIGGIFRKITNVTIG